MSTIEVRIPGRVWEDALDPMTTAMQAELGLPQPSRQKKGRGWTAVYEQVPADVALELALYLDERADTLSQQSPEPRERELYRVMRHTGWVTKTAARATLESAASA